MCSTPEIPFSTYIAKPENYSRNYGTGETVTLACKKGFKEVPGGNPIRICISGRWTQFPFKCEGTHACRRTIRPARTKCTLECSPESGCGSDKYACLCDGSCGYSCVEKGMSCGKPPAVSNGKLNFTGTSYNDTAHYTCDNGYNLNTEFEVKRCTAKKRWSGLTPRCLRDCARPAVPRNAIISNPSDSYRSGQKVTFECIQGFNPAGMATQMCFQGGWTVLPFKCTEGGCGEPGTPKNGRKVGMQYSVNYKVYFDCDLGYELWGSEERKCQQNGTWTGQQPVCKVVDCGIPQKPENGRIVGNETTFRSSITYECDEGYELQGTKERMCTSDKKWSGRDVICSAVDCGQLPPPMNGSLSSEETTFPIQVEISCNDGFILRGAPRRSCQANKTWSGRESSCQAVDCGPLTPPMNGSSVGNDTTFPSITIFKCDAGFDLIGSLSRRCMANKTWSGTMPFCKAVKCGELPPPMNGSVMGGDTTFPNQVEISCDEGFILRGSSRRKCQADRTWSGGSTFCEAINCGKPTVPDHGSVLGKSTRYPHEITLICAVGYENEGSAVRRCQANGTWSGSEATCNPIDCGPLKAPVNGTKNGERTTFLTKLTFQCDDGFEMTGSSSRMCQSNKQWGGEETFCTAKDCGSLGTPLNGTKSGNQTTYPNKVIFSCDYGFDLRGSSERMCTAQGKWTGVLTICDVKDCGSLEVPLNGSLVGKSLTTFPNLLTFKCDKGFVLKGSSVRQCQADGIWSGKKTSCQAKDCGAIVTPPNGTIIGSGTTYPNEVAFSCDNGFHLKGSRRRRCTMDGVWNGFQTMCKANDCGFLTVPLNGSLVGPNVTTFPNSVTFTCDDGFILTGSPVRKCQADAVWSGTETYCQAKDCGPLASPLNGTRLGNQTTYPHVMAFFCDDGFHLKGSERRHCTADGTWGGVETICEAKDCGIVGTPLNGTKQGSQTTYPSEVIFSCDDGFQLRGSKTRHCTADGTWSGDQAFCKAKECGPIATPMNGTKLGSQTTYPSEVTFSCDDGFHLRGSKRRRCTADGTWSGLKATCEAKDCGLIDTPLNGTKLGSETTYPNEISFSCDDGFLLRGSKRRRCTADGTWSGVETKCEARDCGFLKVPLNGSLVGSNVTIFPNSMTFACDKGFILRGSPVRNCQADAVWSGTETFCQAKDCGPIGTPMNGSKEGNQTTYPNEMTFSCDDGFILRGSLKRHCTEEGTWNGVKTFCEAKDCGPLRVPSNGSLFGSQTTYPSEVSFKCDYGFILRGPEQRRCTSEGAWSGSATTCEAVSCGYIAIPQNGSRRGEEMTYPNSVEFRCGEGFIMVGSVVRKCLANGTWDGQETICKARDCGPLSSPINGSSSGRYTTFPNSLSFYCDVGFIMIGSQTRRCKSNGYWSGNETSCRAVECGPLVMPTNGSSYGELTTYPNKVFFQCDDGFTLKGSSARICMANGSWSGIDTSCEAVDCGLLSPPRNGSVRGSLTIFPNVIDFACDRGFTLEGSPLRWCQANATWSGKTTSCKAVSCGYIAIPQNGSRRGEEMTYPYSVEFSCNEGFVMVGPPVRNCLANGTWDGQETICKAQDCGPLPSPINGSSRGHDTTFPNSISFSCDVGFIMIGSQTRSCKSNGFWSGDETSCRAVNCGQLSPPRNGSLRGSVTVFPNVVDFACDRGFTLEGSPSRWCQANGTWSGETTICKAKDCGSLLTPNNGSLLGNETTYPNSVSFSCHSGFDIIGTVVRTCQANGRWSGEQPNCRAVDCGPLPVLLNGSHTGNLTTYPNKVTFHCDNGFLLRGSALRFCDTNRTWSGTQTACEARDCGYLPVPNNGSITGNKTTYPNQLSFSCDDGFDLIGSSDRQCQAVGKWSGKQPHCKAVDCGPLPKLLNGSYADGLTTYPNKATFSCDEGFLLRGSAERVCQANATWSGTQTKCDAIDCGPLDALSNGSSSGDLTVYPNGVRFSCDPGFLLVGSSKRVCMANGTWSGFETSCKPVDCGEVQVPKNGSIHGNSTTFPNKLHFYCDEGFVLKGSSVRACLASATWSGTEATCKAKDCGPLDVPQNSSVFGRLTTFPNEVSIRCDEGFIMTGPAKRKCQADGAWSGNVTLCTAVDCGRLPAPVNGTIHGEQSTYPSTLQFTCNEGFSLHGPVSRNCQANGTWSGTKTNCQANDCGPLMAPKNGSLFGSKTTYPNKITLSCDEGFILVGSAVRQCQANKTWDGLETLCEAIDCRQLKAPLNGSSSGNLTFFPNVKSFTCNPGFILDGSKERVCQANGTWSGLTTSCTAIDCGPLLSPKNGTISGVNTRYPNVLRFDCDEGFTLNGPHERHCQASGKWSGNNTFCQPNDCGPLPVPMNGTSSGTETTYPNEIRFDCDEGFILRGFAVRQCQPNKRWSGSYTSCEAVDCGNLDTPLNGSLTGNRTVYPNSVHFECDSGFILSGSVVRKCQANGTWDGTKTKCNAVDCGPQLPPKNGRVFGNQTTYPNSLRFECSKGFTLNGSYKRNCQTNGTWSGQDALCQAKDCGPLLVPANGTLSGNLTTFPNQISFNCDAGFILRGSALRQCQPDRQWSGNATSCEAVDCGTIDAPANGSLVGNQTVFPNSVQFACDLGFIRNGSSLRTCQANGTWDGTKTVCNAINCGVLQTPLNGSMIGEMTTFPSIARFYCDEGFTLHGSASRKCQANGRWHGKDVLCKANDCGPLQAPSNGSLFGNHTTYPNKVIFTCDEGFILHGSALRYCQSDKRWSGNNTVCKAKDCGLLHVPINGSTFGNMTTFPNNVKFVCNDGFNLKGSRVRQCLSTGNWSGNNTVCEARNCGPLSAPFNGSVIGNQYTYPNKISFQCDEGFILMGSELRECQASGVWSGKNTFCEAIDCGPLSTPLNGLLFGNLTVYPNRVHFGCDQGFFLLGSYVRTCQPNGTWNGSETFCEAVDCGQPRPLKNGSISGGKTMYPNVMQLSCEKGFILRGSSQIRCQTDGTWSNTSSFCDAMDCGQLAVPYNGSIMGNETRFPNKVSLRCDEGFILHGSIERRCEANGSWSGFQTTCKARDCGPLSVPTNGSSSGNLTTFPNTVVFGCDDGFILVGSDTRGCQANGSWSGSQTFCQAKDCGPLSIPLNGSKTGNETSFPNELSFSCDEGFILYGSVFRRCEANGSWSGTETFCKARDCGGLPVPTNGSYSGNLTTFPNEIVFGCDNGFLLVGSGVRRCLANGSWSGNQTFCKAVDCGLLPVPINGSLSGDLTVFPNAVLFECDPGFVLRGSSRRTCRANATWSGSSSVCDAKECGPLSIPLNGSMSGRQTSFPNEISFSCDEGFILHGSAVRWCKANGSWSGNQTTCAARNCGSLPVPTNGSSFGDLTTFPNKIIFSCDDGFNLMGSVVRRCLANGTWSGNQLFCEARDCGPLPIPQNGSYVGELTVFPNKILFDCDEGFNLRGSSVRYCQKNGTWGGYQTFCAAADCGPPQLLKNGSTSGGSTVYPNLMHLSCDEGFILRGPSEIHCQANGSWSNSSTFCEAVDCGLPQPLRNGTITGENTVFPRVMHLSCDEGFLLRGPSEIQCKANGRWGKISSYCEAVDCGPITVPKYAIHHGNSTTYPNIVTFSCEEGFFIQGISSRTCQADGRWTTGDVRCRGVDCGLLSPPENGWMFGSKTSHPHNVSFTCRTGYRLVGSSQRTCLRNGLWSGEQPICLAHWCGKAPQVPVYAYQTRGTEKLRYEHEENIYYSCNPGYIMQGIPKRQCVMGDWSPIKFRCSAPSCNDPRDPNLSYITAARGSQGKYLDGDKVYYSCRSGYKLAGIPEIECQRGVWTKHQFICEPVSCGALPYPPNGLIQRMTGTTFTAVYVFRCKEALGYIMKGSTVRRCLANATWSGVQPTCYMQTCQAPPRPRYGKTTPDKLDKYQFGRTIQYHCNNGFSVRGQKTARCQIDGNWSNPVPRCTSCSSPLGLKNRMIFSNQITASSERDPGHSAKYGRLDGNSAWCSARSSLPEYFQIDFGRLVEVTAVATQGHPKEHKWVVTYVLRYSLGKHWHTYQESGRDKVFQGNKDRNSVSKHSLKETLVAKRLRILRYKTSGDFMGSTACLRAEVFGCYFISECLAVGSEVFARWNTIDKHTRYFHGFITKIDKTSVEVTPSGNHGAKVDKIVELPRSEKLYVVINKQSNPSDIRIGAEVIVSSDDRIGFSQGKVTQKFATWYGVELGNGSKVWKKATDIRLLKSPVYCDRE
ncbi:sushi, von Willebrand factor type A, EGF and pentraxin domain-containing protein 1-like isoform X1 [Montipora foliosa]|uniref:sushi, von Willebrand factor type A, EGF and pentraxin domain-containing protein 1-like isoform X1 n=1 Tax=Montipora foliosa TaxID=591990 RepID=UPI0035F1B05E